MLKCFSQNMFNRLLYVLWKNKKEVDKKLVKRAVYFTNNKENRRQRKKDLKKTPHIVILSSVTLNFVIGYIHK